jgi:hypothetical protein
MHGTGHSIRDIHDGTQNSRRFRAVDIPVTHVVSISIQGQGPGPRFQLPLPLVLYLVCNNDQNRNHVLRPVSSVRVPIHVGHGFQLAQQGPCVKRDGKGNPGPVAPCGWPRTVARPLVPPLAGM